MPIVAPVVALLTGVWPDATGPLPVPNISIVSGCDARVRLTVRTGSSSGAVKNIAGCTVSMLVGHGVWLPIQVGTITDAANGVVEWTLLAASTTDVRPFSYPVVFSMADATGAIQQITGVGFFSLRPATI